MRNNMTLFRTFELNSTEEKEREANAIDSKQHALSGKIAKQD
jgi:hypothetical protein